MQSLNPSVRVRAEGSALVVKSIATITMLGLDSSSELGLVAFGVGQLAFSITMLVVYLGELWPHAFFVLRRSPATSPNKSRYCIAYRADNSKFSEKSRYLPSILRPYFDENLLEVSLAMTGQGLMKHFLTEGDKVSLTFPWIRRHRV